MSLRTCVVVMLLAMSVSANAGQTMSEDEKAIRAMKDVFVAGFLKKDAKLRASIWTDDGTVAPPTGGFFAGRRAIERDFQEEVASVTETSRMASPDAGRRDDLGLHDIEYLKYYDAREHPTGPMTGEPLEIWTVAIKQNKRPCPAPAGRRAQS